MGLISLLILFFCVPVARAGSRSTCQPDATQPIGAIYRICMPAPGMWNGDLVVFAHGYVAFNEPIAIPEDHLIIGGVSVPALVNALGFAFATNSYSINGLAIVQGMNELKELVDIFKSSIGVPNRVYLIGPSEGGIITALSVEAFPQVYSGGLAACGPIGDFRGHVNYLGDFRVVFDYFFPGVLPPSPIAIPDTVIANWETVYVPAIEQALQSYPSATAQLLNVTGAPIGADPATVAETVIGILWYNAFGTNDATQKLGGQPFGNLLRIYTGSNNDLQLNRMVQRFAADAAALAEIEAKYQTSGHLLRPVVTLHTTGDPIIPYWHEPLYRAKVMANGSAAMHVNIPIVRYGHCEFTAAEALIAFVVLIQKVTGAGVPGAENALPDTAARAEFRALAKQWGVTVQ